MIATSLQRWVYGRMLKPLAFAQDPEDVHDRAIAVGRWLGRFRLSRAAMSILLRYRDPLIEQEVLGIHFPNPIGLAAGFDKNAQLTSILPSVGFGFEEIGSITGQECAGNPKPRLWRHPDLQSLRVYYGLKNDGCEEIAGRLQGKQFSGPVGVSIAKTNCADTVEMDAAIADYVKAYKAFKEIGDYDTVNISCPNAYGGQPFTDVESLDALLAALVAVRNSKPMFLKLSPDLELKQLHAIADVAKKHRVDGLIVSNLTKNHDLGKGGLGGKAVADGAMKHLVYLAKTFPNDFVLVSCGGLFTAEDVYDRIKHGASLVQLITGMIYEGPQLIGEMNRGLARLLRRDGFKNIDQAIGAAYHS